MSWKKLIINGLLAGAWVAASYILDDPRLIIVAPFIRIAVGYALQKLGYTVPVDTA